MRSSDSVFTRFRFTTLLTTLIGAICLVSQAHAAFEKSPNDHKAYEAFELDNQLEVLIISDPTADKAAASMNVAVGSNANPVDRAGLAHFLEHMLFLGTKKYPMADEYQNFIRSHGGGHNAYTSQDNTNYFFDVSAPHLEPALDRFAQFFISPMFDENYVNRERHAVHSEYQAKIRDDFRRGYAATKQAMNTAHSHNRFAVGSLETLADRPGSSIRDELIRFYDKYYSSNLMSLVVLGKEPLPELKAMVIEKFAAIKNQQAVEFRDSETLFKPNQLPQKLFIEPVKDIRSLTLAFPIPAYRAHWEKKPLGYISSLIGYEGQGSLLSMLKEKGWATALSASAGHDLPDEGTMMVMIQLTEKGLKGYMQVTQAFFQYVELLKQEGLVEALFEEEKQLSAIQFRFQEQSEPIHLVSRLAAQMQRFPTDKVISAGYTYSTFDPELIRTFLAPITPDNLFLTLSAKGQETDQVENYYSTPYRIAPITKAELNQLSVKAIDSALTIRSPNPFVAENLDILASDDSKADKPMLITDKNGFEIWYKQDTEFNVPRANFYFTLQSHSANSSAKNAVLNHLFTQMIQEQLNETLYDAFLAGMGTEIYPHMRGMSVRLSGYNDKLDLLLEKVVTALKQPDFNADRFAILKRQHVERLQNSFNDKPYNQTTSKLYELLMPQFDKATQLKAAENVTLKELEAFSKTLLNRPTIKVLAHGNIAQPFAEDMGKTITHALYKKSAEKVTSIPITQIPKGQPLTEVLNVNHTDAAISVLLQGENNSPASRGSLAVLAEILSSPFYNELRTEKQLGYIVFATPLQMNKTPGLAFIVQSPNTNADDLEANITGFLDVWQPKLAELTQEEVDKYKQSVLSRINQKDNKLSTRTKRFWRELDWEELNFDTRSQLSNAVEATQLQDIQTTLSQLLERKLTVKTYGTKMPKVEKTDSKEELASAYLKASDATVPDA